jgi:putative transposase
MPHSLDLRKKLVGFIEKGGSISEAAKVYQVSRSTIYRWLGRENLAPIKVTQRKRKLDREALRKDIEENPDTILSERAKKFGVSTNAIWSAIQKMKITRRKKSK